MGSVYPESVRTANGGSARQIDIEARIFALDRERPPQGSSLETPVQVLLANPSRDDRGIGQMKVRAARSVPYVKNC